MKQYVFVTSEFESDCGEYKRYRISANSMQEACEKISRLGLLRGHSLRRYDGKWEEIEIHSGGWASFRTDPKGWCSEVIKMVGLQKGRFGASLCRVLDGSAHFRVYYCDEYACADRVFQGTLYESLMRIKDFALRNNLIDNMRCQIREFYKARS